MKRVHLQDQPATPWRNGGGTTRDLLTWPAPDEGWQVRVSVALIDRSGPFSVFAGVARWFTVLEGAGVHLDLPAGRHTLRPGDAPLHFDGADAPGCELIGGATHDLNFMAPHAAGRARMQAALPGIGVAGPTRWRGLFTTSAAVIHIAGADHRIDPDTLVWSDDPEAGDWKLVDANAAWWLTLEA
jgi:environmental stress-induced protein Ves